MAPQKPAEDIGVKGERAHNVIVPIEPNLLIGTITKSYAFWIPPHQKYDGAVIIGGEAPTAFGKLRTDEGTL